jgi:hypothetical protein
MRTAARQGSARSAARRFGFLPSSVLRLPIQPTAYDRSGGDTVPDQCHSPIFCSRHPLPPLAAQAEAAHPQAVPPPAAATPRHSVAVTKRSSSSSASRRASNSARPSADNRRTMGGPPVGISPHNYSSAVAKNKCLADSNKTRTSAKPTNNQQSALRSFHPTECRSHSGPRQPFAALTRGHLTPEAGTNCHRLA